MEEACLPLEEVLKKYGIRVRLERSGNEKNKFLSPKVNARKKQIHENETSPTEENDDGAATPPESPDQSFSSEDSSKLITNNNKDKILKRSRNGKVKSFLANEEINKNSDAAADEVPDHAEVAPPSTKRIKQDGGEINLEENLCKLNSTNESTKKIELASGDVKENGYVRPTNVSDNDNEEEKIIISDKVFAGEPNEVVTCCDSSGSPPSNEPPSVENGGTKNSVKKSVEQMFNKNKQEKKTE